MRPIDEVKKVFRNDRFATENGVEIIGVDDDYAKCRMLLAPKHRNARGAIMGGAIYTLADFAFAVASNWQGQGTVTLNSSITFLNSTKGDVLFAEAVCEKNGSRAVTYRVDVTDETEKLIAVVYSTGMHVKKL